MLIIQPKVVVKPIHGIDLLMNIEEYGRTCYKSEEKITPTSYKKFINMILSRGHLSMLEHEKVTVRVICDRGVSHEIVRHRIASYSQESTRYCSYGDKKGGITVIKPFFFDENVMGEEYTLWEYAMHHADKTYNQLLRSGRTPQEARDVLPNSLKTEIVVTYNLREWMHFFSLRCAKDAHPQMQQIAIPLLLHFRKEIPFLYDNIDYNVDFDPIHYAEIELTPERRMY